MAIYLSLAIRVMLPEDAYMFAPSPDKPVILVRGDYYIMGKLDFRGEFTETSRRRTNAPGSVMAEIINMTWAKKPVPVYEYRSGRLIKGVLDTDGYFVPDLDSKVIEFKDYRYKPGGIYIYNLPGEFVKKRP